MPWRRTLLQPRAPTLLLVAVLLALLSAQGADRLGAQAAGADAQEVVDEAAESTATPMLPVAQQSDPFVYLDLRPFFNNDAISWDHDPLDGDINFAWTTLPAEFLPDSLTVVSIRSASFLFPPKEDGTNNALILTGQSFAVPAGQYSELQLLITAISGLHTGEVTFRFRDGSQWSGKFNVRDFGPAGGTGQFGNLTVPHRHGPYGDQTPSAKIWVAIIRLPEEFADKELVEITLPANDRLRLFALTLKQK
ncbi:MAG: hypothetical protein IMX00_08150 [Limnochordales bacterium]|nr:hypothetical protein [Limnochordales bacterium]